MEDKNIIYHIIKFWELVKIETNYSDEFRLSDSQINERIIIDENKKLVKLNLINDDDSNGEIWGRMIIKCMNSLDEICKNLGGYEFDYHSDPPHNRIPDSLNTYYMVGTCFVYNFIYSTPAYVSRKTKIGFLEGHKNEDLINAFNSFYKNNTPDIKKEFCKINKS